MRFLLPTHGIRMAKDAMSRHIVTRLEEAGIAIATTTLNVGIAPTAPGALGETATESGS